VEGKKEGQMKEGREGRRREGGREERKIDIDRCVCV
jgi:hypothetical protein